MSVVEYAAEIRRHILDTPHAVSHSLAYEDRPPLGAIVNSSVIFADGSCLYFKEFLQLRPGIARLVNEIDGPELHRLHCPGHRAMRRQNNYTRA